MQNKTIYFVFYMIFRTFEVNLEGTFTRKCKIKLEPRRYFHSKMQNKTNLFCILLVYSYLCMVLGNTQKRVSGLKNALKRKIVRKTRIKY